MQKYQKWLVAGVYAMSLSTAFADQPRANKPMAPATAPEMSREITPSAAPIAAEGARFFFSGDFIFWEAKEDNLGIGATGVIGFDSSGTVLANAASITSPGHEGVIDAAYEPGFKFGAGLVFAHDGWDTFMNYTWLQETNRTASIVWTAASGPVYSYYFNAGNSASGSWNFYFNEIDWELGRKFFISKRLVLRPHFGLKGAWLHQNFSILETASSTYSMTTTDSYANTYQRQKYWGVGFRAGLNTEWHFTRDFSIYGNFALSELYGLMHLKTHGTVLDPASGIDAAIPAFNTRKNQHTMRPVLEMAMGFRYETCFGEDNYYRFLAQVGWEQQTWWDQNQFVKVLGTATQTSNDLMFQGLDVKLGFAF